MKARPSEPWSESDPELSDAPVEAGWREVGTGRHVFTHFALDYRVMAARLARRTAEGEWWPVADLDGAGLPTLFVRAAAIGQSAMESA